MEKLLTIVVPAFNMEKYLRRCIDSICIESVMNRVQVIVVNDGSKDRTSEIAHEYEQKYPHYIQVIDKENGNYGSCMNVGLSLAKGKYFRTLDADDWYNTDAYEKFVKELENTDADMIITTRIELLESSGEKRIRGIDNSIICNQDIHVSDDIWGKYGLVFVASTTFKVQILISVGMTWDENAFYTDNEYITIPLKSVKTVRFIDYPVYSYMIGRAEQSVSPDNLKKYYDSHLLVTRRLISTVLNEQYKNSGNYEIIKKILLISLLPHVYRTLLYEGRKNKTIIHEIDKELQSKDFSIYQAVDFTDDFKGAKYIYAYHHNKLLYCYIRSNYLIRNLAHKFLGK